VTTARGVGAHTTHLTGTTVASAILCTSCHVVPSLTNMSHADGTAQVQFSGTAVTGGAAASYNATAATCTNYCHGSTLSGGQRTTPVWNSATPTTYRACNACHGLAPNTGEHSEHSRISCDRCHGSGYSTSRVVAATHVNGVKNVALSAWNASTKTCSRACHGSESWSGGSSGGSSGGWGGR
jgi:predicted CxxxxCH...CXXCH cytochrome family protein